MTDLDGQGVAGPETLKRAVYFGGAATTALLIAVLLHELGHAAAVLWTGGAWARITFNPLVGAVTSYATVGADPADARFITAGGVIFGSIFSLVVSAPFLPHRRNLWAIPLAMIAVAALAGNGLMLLLGVGLANVGDATQLMGRGVPKAVLLSLGAGLLLLGFYFFLRLSPGLGFGRGVCMRRRYMILAGGLAPYELCILGYNAATQMEKIPLYLSYALGGVALGLLAVLLGGLIQARIAVLRAEPAVPVQWRHAVFTACLVLVLMTVIVIFLWGDV